MPLQLKLTHRRCHFKILSMIVNKVICGPFNQCEYHRLGFSAAIKAEKFIILRIKYTNFKIYPRWISLLLMP